jgi:hypothetical protein
MLERKDAGKASSSSSLCLSRYVSRINCGSPVKTSMGTGWWFPQPMACGDKGSVKAEDMSKLRQI